MPAPQSPITSLLAWLVVSVLLQAGAPAPRPAAAGEDGASLTAAAQELAPHFAPLGLAARDDSAPHPFGKVRVLAETLTGMRLGAPKVLGPRHLKPRRAAPPAARRASLVGLVELRL